VGSALKGLLLHMVMSLRGALVNNTPQRMTQRYDTHAADAVLSEKL